MSKGRRQATRHGYVVIDKPAGWTSHDVVARVRRLVGERRVGHAGTLDPAATGVLPVAVGLATRTVEYLANASKSYRAAITFGIATDTADAEGAVVAHADATHLDLQAITQVLPRFTGPIQQRPPMHSAIKVDGVRLYELARKGIDVDVQERSVVIEEIQIVHWESPVLTLDVTCSKGTYIRSLARDLGDAVGTGAHLSGLVRTRTGPFTLADAMSLEQLELRLRTELWSEIALPPDAVLDDLPRIDMSATQAVDWGHGKPVPADHLAEAGAPVRAYDEHGIWRGIGHVAEDGAVIHPAKVIPAE